MKKFDELSKKKAQLREKEISKYWEEIDLLHHCVKEREGCEPYIFYEGPPTANGKPGIHHVMARTLKDLTCRYKTMKGFQVKRKGGWDTHGLPVEIEVEKELGINNKQEIVEYGIEKFNQKCRESVFKYEKLWREMSEDMAYLVDMDDPYITLDNNYIESVWYILDKFYKEGLLYEGHKILPYCSRCGTGLASHEVAQGYENIKTDTVIVRFKEVGEEAYFLAWTTTPWTLPSNVALTVNPNVEYIKAKADDGKIYYCAKALSDKVLGEDYEILSTYLGKDLEYKEYEQLIPEIEVDKKAFFVTCADYVTIEDGTGIVHTAPAFGDDDYNTGLRYDLPVVKPVDLSGKFTDTQWKGMFVMDADPDIIQYLRDKGLLVRKQKVEHNYPHCWRCHTPLLYYAKPSWYIEVTKFKDLMVENNNKVNWYPNFVGEKRFGNWLENLNDWAISRTRYWGTPLPLWRCTECGEIISIGSRKELKEKAIGEVADDLDLHRPYVDDVNLKCEKCGGVMYRETDLIDVWFDSGAMPFAQWHYPFEHKDDFDTLFPADFICEGIDQTRGWFYSLMAISTLLTGKSSFKNVLVNDLVLDKDGKKMSKSRGNTVDPFLLFEQYGADVLRWYLVYVSVPWVPTKFDEDGLKEVESKFFRSIRNVYNFFSLYTGTEGIDPTNITLDEKKFDVIDEWILSKYNKLIRNCNNNMEIFEVTRTVHDISDFVIEDLSNWYIRRNRRRFWQEDEKDKEIVFKITYDILLGLSKLIAPFTPFLAEELYRHLTDGKTVHTEHYPSPDETKIDDKVEHKMDLVRMIVSLGRASREKMGIKVRQPLSEVLVEGKYEEEISDLVNLIKEELNVKNVRFEYDLPSFMDYTLKPDFKEAGAKLGAKIKSFQKLLNEIDAKELVETLQNEGKTTLNIDGEDTEILKEYVIINVKSKEGFDVEVADGIYAVLETKLTDSLIDEGFARELISKIQNLRKSSGFEVVDRINIKYEAGDKLKRAIENFKEIIMDETLALSMEEKENQGEEMDINGEMAKVYVERV